MHRIMRWVQNCHRFRMEERCSSAMQAKPCQPHRRHCLTRKELVAIVVFTRQFRFCVLGQPFIVRTDHHSLAWLLGFENIKGQLARWLEELSQYNMTVQHRSGKAHCNADGLSRIPSLEPPCDCYDAGRNISDLPCGGCKYC